MADMTIAGLAHEGGVGVETVTYLGDDLWAVQKL